MSHNQSRGDMTNSGQYRKTGRSSSFNQQRHLSGGFKGDGGGGGGSSFATRANPFISNRSLRSSNVIQDSSHSFPAPVVQNGAQLCQPSPGVSDALVTSKSVNVTPINALAQRITQTVPRSPSSTNASTASSATPAKDASSSFSLQFGCISPGFMNEMQIPARTSSAPPNLDEQKEDKACHDSLKAAHLVPTPTIPKHRLPKKDTRVLDQPNTGEAQPVSKSKRDAQVSATPPSIQTQKSSVDTMSGMSMQMQFHQSQVPVQFGVPNPQIQSQATPTSSLPNPIQMGMSIPLLMGNPPMFVSGCQPPNAIQSQGLMHQGQNLNYSSQMGHQMPPQFGNMGINMAPQFPPQQAVNFTASHKTVKITHSETHGGLQRNSSDSDWWQHGTAFLKGLMPPSQTSLQVMHRAEKKYEVGKVSDEEEIKQRKLKAILNELNSQNFEKLFEQVKQVNIDNVVTLSGLVSQIFDKVLTKPTFCEMYANFCFHLAAELPDLSVENERITFKRLLLNKCQMEFERGEKEEEEEVNKADEEGQAKHSEEKRLRARRRMLGNVRLIGELYKKRMLTERIMHECIKKLLGQDQSPEEEDVEALCELMSTIGEMIDHPRAKEYMDAYFDIMAQLSNNMKLPSRVRFMLKDLINLRNTKWQQRRKVERPKKIDEVHRDAAELGPHGGLQRNNSDSDRWQCGTAFQKGLIPSPQTPLQVMHKAEKKYEIGKVSDEEEIKQRQLKAILNKLTPQNFEKLFEQVKQVNIDNVVTLSGVISQIFDKALMEPTLCEMYANFCFHLAAELPDLIVENERITFKRLLLNKCQEEFERGEKEEEEANKADEEGQAKQSEEEREEKRLRARRRMLGNIRLIGELYKKKMLTERIMHECIKKLLGQYQNPDEEDVEALCKLMSTIGEMIDHPKAKEHMDAYFDIMAQLSNNMKLSSRLRFMLKDSIDLRKNKWQQRRKVEGPKKINEVHRDAAQERQAQASRLARAPTIGTSGRRGPPLDFAPRVPNLLSSPSPQMVGLRAVPLQLRGHGFQDVRLEERHHFENRNISVSLPQRPLSNDSITLGPHGGLARGMAFRGQPSAPGLPLVEISSPGDARRIAPSLNGFSSVPERTAYGQREDLMLRYMPERFSSPSVHDQSNLQERSINHQNRDIRNADHNLDRSLPTSSTQDRPPAFMQDASSEKMLPEERLQHMSMSAIKEFYSARDENEVALCIKELNAPSFYPSMISLWVADSFERNDTERDLLTKLLIGLMKARDGMISQDQLIKGFESVLTTLEDAVNDAPRAAEFLGRIFAKVIIEDVISFSEVGRLIYEGGEEQGSLVEIGLATEVLGSILETIKSEMGDSVLTQIRSSSNMQLENFRPPGSNKSWRLDKFT